ncbi:MAG TPA: chemotaxis protein MotB [Bacteroidetes bacterium]|nr:chemotaxis protein MotB [Bacteroidota bacterium]
MVNQKDIPIRIIKKIKKGHGGHHGGAWKVAYADFVTAMMALFIVLWIVGQSKQVKDYVAQYFKDPGAFMENTKGGGAFEKSDMSIGERVTEEFLKRQQEQMKDVAEKIVQEMSKVENLKELIKQIKMEFTKEGLRIELVEESQSFFFDVGTSNIKPEAILILEVIAKQLGEIKNNVVIEGHTDARPYLGGTGYTNFELSAERANSARRVLMDKGLNTKQIVEIRGYADSRLRNKANPLDVTNRRISILVKYDEQ